MAMVEDDDARNYQPLYVLYQSAVLKYAGPTVRQREPAGLDGVGRGRSDLAVAS